MSVSVGELVAKLKLDTSDFSKGASTASSQSKSLSSTISSNLSSIGGNMTKFVTLPILAVGAALLQIGTQFDDAFDTIRTGTGQTGAALEGLQESFRNVVADVPASFADASMAIADLSTRTGATGQALEDLTKTELELARITGGDLKAQIASTTRLFGDWGIATEKQASSLDFLFRVGQQTGISVDSLSSKLVQFGAPLRQMGFDFETSAALMGKFEKEGVNLELVMGSLRIALGKMSKEGIKDPAEALKLITQRIKDAGSAGEANAMALKSFGARAGPDMAAAIREGRFEIDSLLSTLRSSPETIMGAAKETADFAEQFTLLKNQVMLALEPLGAKLFQALNNLMPAFQAVVGWIKSAVEGFSNLPSGVQTTIAVLVGLAAAVGPVLLIAGKLIAIFSGASAAIALLTNPIGLAIAALVAIGIAVVAAYKHFESFREIVDSVAKFIADAFKQIWSAIKSFADSAWPVLVGLWKEYKDTVLNALQPVIQVWTEHKDLILKVLGAIALGLTGPIGAIVLFATKFKDSIEHIKDALSNFAPFFKQVWENALTVVETVWKAISNAVAAGVKLLSSIVKAFQGNWEGAWTDYKAATEFAWNAILAVIEGAGKLMLGILNAAWELVKGAAATAWDALKVLIKASWAAIESFLIQSVPNLIGQLVSWFSELPNKLPGYAEQAWAAIRSAFETGKTRLIAMAKESYEGVRKWLADEVPKLVDEMSDNILKRIAALSTEFPTRMFALGVSAFANFKAGMDAKSPTGPEKLIIQMAKGMGVTLDEAIPKLSDKAQKLGDAIAKHINDGLKSIGLTFDVSLREILNFSDKWKKAADEIGDKAKELAETKRKVGLVIALSYDFARKTFDEYLEKVKAGSQTIVKVSHDVGKAVADMSKLEGAAHAAAIEAWLAHERAADETADAIKRSTEEISRAVSENLRETFRDLSNELPASWNKIIDGILNGSGRLGDELLKLGVKVKGWAADIIGVVGTIPGAFGDAARKVLSTVDQWVQFADRVLAILHRLFSSIPGSIEDMVTSITGGLTKAQQQVEAVLDDVYGPAIKKATVATEGLGTASEGSGDQIRAAFALAAASVAAFATGMSVAAATSNRAIGSIVGGLQGALSGFAIGGIFGAAVGGISGVLGGIFGKTGPSKEELEEQKKAAAQAFAEQANSIVSGAMQAMKDSLSLLDGLTGYTGTAKKSIKRFINDLEFILHEMFDALKSLAQENWANAKAFGENLGPAISLMGSSLSLFNSLRDYTKVPEQAIKDLIADFSILEGLLEEALADVELKVVKQMGKISNKLVNSFELLKLALEVIKGAGEYKPIETSIFDSLFADLYSLIDRFSALADEFKTFALAKTKKSAEQMAAIVESIGSSIGVLKSIGEYQKIGAEVFATITDDLRAVLGWQDSMIALADEGILKGLTFQDRMAEWGAIIARGLSALASIAGGSFSVTAGAGLSALSLPGTSVAPSSRFSPSASISGSPSPITQQGGGQHITVTFAPGAIVVPGLLGTTAELQQKIGDFVVKAITTEKRAGRIQFAT